MDAYREGLIKLQVFEKILNDLHVFVSREELKKLAQMSTGGDNEINYVVIADAMHLPKVFEGGETGRYLDKVSKLKMKITGAKVTDKKIQNQTLGELNIITGSLTARPKTQYQQPC